MTDTQTPLALLYNVFCMGAQERDKEWEYQWRQLMQAIELELTAAGYKVGTGVENARSRTPRRRFRPTTKL
jgi:hypothetical protein